MNRKPSRRDVLTASAVFGSASIATLGAYGMNRSSSRPIEIDIVSKSDGAQIQRVSEMQVEVTNHGQEPVLPRFSALREGLQTRFYWDISEDERTVDPQSTSYFDIRASISEMAIPYDERFVLAVEDERAEHGSTVSDIAESPGMLVPIRNPSFDYWYQPGDQAPQELFRWFRSVEQRGRDQVNIRRTARGVEFSVTRSNHQGPWTMGGVSQRVPALGQLSMTAIPDALGSPDSFQSETVCGLEVIDRNHRIWAVYANVNDRLSRTYSRGTFDYHVEYFPAEGGQKSELELDLTRIYKKRGWNRPPRQPLAVDGIEYPASTMILHPFAASYRNRSSSAMSLLEMEASYMPDRKA